MHHDSDKPAAGQTFHLTRGIDLIKRGNGDDTIVATSGTLSRGDIINAGDGTNTLMLVGGGRFDLALPAKFKNIRLVEASETTVRSGGVTDPYRWDGRTHTLNGGELDYHALHACNTGIRLGVLRVGEEAAIR